MFSSVNVTDGFRFNQKGGSDVVVDVVVVDVDVLVVDVVGVDVVVVVSLFPAA